MPRTHAPDDVGIPDRVTDGDDPKIPGSFEQDSEEQPDRENGREHWHG
jgi:hypothetical protein